MSAKTLADLEKMGPEELQKLGIRYLNESDFAKLGIKPFDLGGSNISGTDISKLNYIKNDEAITKFSNEMGENKKEKSCAKKRHPPLFMPWRPFRWGKPLAHKKKVASARVAPVTEEERKEPKEDIQEGLFSPKVLPKTTSIDNKTNQNDLDNTFPDTAEKRAGDDKESLEIEKVHNNNEQFPAFNEESSERVFQLERCKRGIEIKSNLPQVVPLKVFKPRQHK